MRSRTRVGCAAVIAVLALGACAGGGQGAPPGSGVGEEDAGPVGAEIEATNFAFEPTEISIAQGESVKITNAGKTLHNFTVDGEDVTSGNVPSGQSATANTSSLEPGSYEFFCSLHRAAMQGTLEVEG
ncbi:MAG: cupredoxin domain-containing protein [Actinomycetota bacterium]